MNDRTAIEWLNDARSYASEARKLTSGLTQEVFDTKRRDQLAVFFCLATVGEALNQVPKDVQALAPEVPWVAINGLRNRLVHSFWLIDTEIVLRIAQNETAALILQIERLIEKIR